MDEREPFLKRWSRLKREVQVEPSPTVDATHEATEVAPLVPSGDGGGPVAASHDDVEPLDLDKLPKLEELSSETDFRPFLDVRVPTALRNAALQRMWTLDPTIRDFIEVAEYQWNWNVPGGAPGYEATLPPGTDIAKLLAQATGAIDKAIEQAKRDGEPAGDGPEHNRAVAADEPNTPGLGGPESMAEDVAALPSLPSSVRLTTTAPVTVRTDARAVVPHAAAHNHGAAPAAPKDAHRRRHGGALAD